MYIIYVMLLGKVQSKWQRLKCMVFLGNSAHIGHKHKNKMCLNVQFYRTMGLLSHYSIWTQYALTVKLHIRHDSNENRAAGRETTAALVNHIHHRILHRPGKRSREVYDLYFAILNLSGCESKQDSSDLNQRLIQASQKYLSVKHHCIFFRINHISYRGQNYCTIMILSHIWQLWVIMFY